MPSIEAGGLLCKLSEFLMISRIETRAPSEASRSALRKQFSANRGKTLSRRAPWGGTPESSRSRRLDGLGAPLGRAGSAGAASAWSSARRESSGRPISNSTSARRYCRCAAGRPARLPLPRAATQQLSRARKPCGSQEPARGRARSAASAVSILGVRPPRPPPAGARPRRAAERRPAACAARRPLRRCAPARRARAPARLRNRPDRARPASAVRASRSAAAGSPALTAAAARSPATLGPASPSARSRASASSALPSAIATCARPTSAITSRRSLGSTPPTWPSSGAAEPAGDAR